MKKAAPIFKYTFTVKCPHCGKIIDLDGTSKDGGYTEGFIHSAFDETALNGLETNCNRCGGKFEFRDVEIL